MSFEKMDKKSLSKVAEFFDIKLNGSETVKEIRTMLADNGRTYQMWEKFNREEEKPESVNFPSTLLVKMVRRNPTFEAYGYKFTREDPYRVLPPEDAEKIMSNYEGFAIATPSEVKAFYS